MQTFAEFDKKVGNRKTGYYGNGVDMYTKRNGNRERVFRVTWPERNVKYPTHEEYKKAERKQRNARRNGFYFEVGREFVTQTQLFPYTEEGLKAALAFSKSVEPKRDAFWNSKQD